MIDLTRVRLLIALGIAAAALTVCAPASAQAEKKERSVKIDFKSADGVTLVGRYYAPMGPKKRDAVVLLLHDFNKGKGGSSKANGYQDLATAMQDDGYAVVSFDFRGFGDSTAVDKDKFWADANNRTYINGAGKKQASIRYDQFKPAYFRHLVNDVAAARAYLDRRNDARDVNVSNLILVGVGEGATIGSAWAYNEARRRKDNNENPPIIGLPRTTGGADPESNNIAGAVWVSLSPTLAGIDYRSHLARWNFELVRNQRITTVFLNGEGKADSTSRTAVAGLLGKIKPSGTRKPGPRKDRVVKDKGAKEPGGEGAMEGTRQILLKDNLSGEKLLDKQVARGILTIMGRVMEARGAKAWEERASAKARFYYTMPNKDFVVKLAKPPKQEVPLVDMSILFGR